MSDVENAAPAAPVKSPKKTKAVKAKKAKTASTHPPVSEMVNAAIGGLKERGGSSLIAIKKYIAANYPKCDVEKLAPFIRRYLRTGVAAGKLIQVKGKGASGSFKLSASEKKEKPKAAAKKEKVAKPKAVKKPAAKKSPKKAKKPAAKKATKPKAAKPKKAKTPKKAAAKKPKAAKPKAKKPAAKKAKK